ncbi:MAG: thioredoxin [Bacteroidales bacterium]
MSAKKSSSRASVKPMVVALVVIVAAIVSLMVFRGNGSAEKSEVAESAADSQVAILTASNFDDTISDGLVLVDFWATWCPPCRIQGPIVEELAGEIGSVATISKLDVDDHGSVAALYEVRNIPTLILFKDGQPVERFVGVQQKETLKAAIDKHL